MEQPAAFFQFFSIVVFCILARAAEVAESTTTFQFTNNCGYTVWPGTLSGAGTPPLSQTGFELPAGASASLTAPPAWSGRFWGRTRCSTDASTGLFKCLTGDCNTGKLDCQGSGSVPPTTLVEITLAASSGGMDFYDISLVDGYNIPVSIQTTRSAVAAAGPSYSCGIAECAGDLNAACPAELRVVEPSTGAVVACKSACLAFGEPRYCCSGAYANPTACGPTSYSQIFKAACPLAYSYAFDDASSTFTCPSVAPAGVTQGDSYVVTFCP